MQKMIFEKDFFKLINNGALGKTVLNMRKHRDIKLVTPEGLTYSKKILEIIF